MARQAVDDYTGKPIIGAYVSIRAVRLEMPDGTFAWIGNNVVRTFQNGTTLGAWVEREIIKHDEMTPDVSF